MKILRLQIKLVIFIGLVSAFVYFTQGDINNLRKYLYYSVCDTPKSYRIDSVDPKFGLKEDKLLDDIKTSVNLWNKAYSRDIFVFDPQGTLSVSFIYDKKQALNTQINSLEGKLNQGKSALDREIQAYEQKVAAFQAKLDAFNSEVARWNEQGGAPPEEYDKIIAQQKDLQVEADSLNDEARRLNLSTKNYNSQVGKLNKTIGEFNAELTERPEEGVYIPGVERIEIYFVPSRNELVHTLAHEFGHSLGIGHTEVDKKAIMYPYTSETVTLSQEDKQALESICQEKSILNDYKARLNVILEQLSNSLTQ